MKNEFGANPADWDEISTYFKDEGNVLFTYCHQGGSALMILLNREFLKVGTMPFGGNPLGRVYVSIRGKGADHFAANFDEDIQPHTLMVRLGVTKVEAKLVSLLFQALRERLV